MKNRAGWLALAVLAVASLLMIFVVMPRIDQDGQSIGEQINAAGEAVKDAVTDGAPKPTETTKVEPQPNSQNGVQESARESNAKGTQGSVQEDAQGGVEGSPAPEAPSQSAALPSPSTSGSAVEQPDAARSPGTPAGDAPASNATAAAVTPSFDVLRVDPDGSTVVAGRASPNSTLEITDGSAVVAKVHVGPSGDFAAVLDAPLPPGDHQLVLKSTAKDGKLAMSEEIATVSVPADKNGKLLAMVSKPGEPSRLVTLPQDTPTSLAQAVAPGSSAVAALGGESATAATDATSANAGAGAGAGSLGVPASSAPAQAAAAPGLQISAVEIEGNQIFIAGKARSGLRVRGSADGTVVGQAQAGQDGHFVIEGRTSLSVGDHRISVESLGTGGQSLLRVEVPFNRPAGEQVAAVAAPASPSSAADAAAKIDGGRFDRLRAEIAKAFALLESLYEDDKVPTPENLAAARSATGIALQSMAEYRLPSGAAIDATETVGAAARDAAAARQALDALPRDVAAVGSALGNLSGMIDKAVGPAPSQAGGVAGQDGAIASTSGSNGAAGADGGQTIQQAALTPSDRSSVIIRRGDTLWQIARRVYGQGVRYTTIYLANEDQIGNPDVIQPGQIFGVPNDYRPDSENLHRERLMHRRS